MTDRREEPATAAEIRCLMCPARDFLMLDELPGHLYAHGIEPPWEAEREALPAPLDVERLLTACARVGLELFPLQGRAIAAEYGRIAPHAASSPDPIEADYQRFLHPASTEPAQGGER